MRSDNIKNPNITTRVVHSKSNPAWNIVGTKLAGKYKIARIPYVVSVDPEVTETNKAEAKDHADFICYCFNHVRLL